MKKKNILLDTILSKDCQSEFIFRWNKDYFIFGCLSWRKKKWDL